MLTSRGWWFLVLVAALLAGGVLAQYDFNYWGTNHFRHGMTLTLIALTLASWFAWEWLLFAVRARVQVRELRVARELSDDEGPVDALWSGHSFEVHVRVEAPGRATFPYLVLEDRVPYGVEQGVGANRYEGPVAPGRPAEFSYRARCPAVGRVRFEGVRVELADLQGFFYFATFLPAVMTLRVLPSLGEPGGSSATLKRHNHLLPPGIHRHPRPGSGSELLDLREYLPGDPPKTIAWKVSARRGRLMTKEFESEVPVRCTLFLDTSGSVRVGPPGRNALSPLVEIAAVVAQAAAGSRDPVGLCLFDGQQAGPGRPGARVCVRPARGSRHLAHLLNLLADAAGLAPAAGGAPLAALVPVAYDFARDVYPELMRPDVNRLPFWLPWLAPQPAWTVRRPTLADRLYGRLPWLLPLAVVGVLLGVAATLYGLFFLLLASPVSPVVVIAVMAAAVVAAAFAAVRLPRRSFFRGRRLILGWRKRLAALLAVRYGLGPGGLGLLMEDDECCALYLQRFLGDHDVPYPLALYDAEGRYLFAAPGKVANLASALLRAVGKEHDNELYVLLADLLEIPDRLAPLLRAVKVALARHHRVVVVCPWPPGVPPPSAGGRAPAVEVVDEPPTSALEGDLQHLTTERFHRAFREVRRAFGRLGVPVVCARSGDPARLILDRLDLMRGLGRRR